MNTKNIIILVIFNFIILAELVFSLYKASQDPENVTLIFFQYFIFLIIPTFILGRIILKKFFARKVQDIQQTLSPESEQQKSLYLKLKTTEEELLKYGEKLQKPQIINGILKKRAFLGKLAAGLIIVMFLSFLDGCANRLMHPMNVLNLLPGQSIKINAPLEKKVIDINELSYITNSDSIYLKFDSIYSGFWLGGTEWRGILTVDPNIKPGEYKVIINVKGIENKRPFVFIVRIHQNKTELQRSSLSLITKTTGISPWIFFISSVILIGITVVWILKLSNNIEAILLKNGQAEVFFVKKGEYITEIVFGLGKKNNVKVGDVLNIYNEQGFQIGKVIVQQTLNENSLGIVRSDHHVKPGFVVTLEN